MTDHGGTRTRNGEDTAARQRRVVAALLALAALYVAALAWRWREYVVDDAYTGFAFLRNLLEGHGFVFHPGGRGSLAAVAGVFLAYCACLAGQGLGPGFEDYLANAYGPWRHSMNASIVCSSWAGVESLLEQLLGRSDWSVLDLPNLPEEAPTADLVQATARDARLRSPGRPRIPGRGAGCDGCGAARRFVASRGVPWTVIAA